MANVILTNGARLYVDHAHPEYSGPEVTSALDAVRYDKAGDAVMAIAAQRATQSLGRSVRLYKNNTDGKGASYGTHENYLLQRSTPFDRIVTQFTAFLVSRQVITGAGRVGHRPGEPAAGLPDQPAGRLLRGRGRAGDDAQPADHQHPRRAARRRQPAPPAARDHRRRQPVGDLHLPQGRHARPGCCGSSRPASSAHDLRLDAPVAAMRAVSHDLTCRRAADPAGRPGDDRGRPAGDLPGGVPAPLRADRPAT